MNIIKPRVTPGFTIVELLVVIVVIGVLATISLVSYSGISQRALITAVQSDLSNSAKLLNIYYVEYGTYPQSIDANKCPIPASARHCLKTSSGNTTYSYYSASPYLTYSLSATNSNTSWRVTHNSPIQPVVAATGGTVTDANGVRTHTFSSSGTFTVTSSGAVDVVIKGAGGGAGGPLWEDYCEFTGDPSPGGYSRVSKSGVDWQANGGGAGSTVSYYCNGSGTDINGAPGATNSPSGWVSTTGGGSAGGSKYTWGSGLDWEQYGSNGGAGGKLEKIGLTVNAGDSYTVTVGTTDARSGTAGIVTFSYPR